MRIFMSALLFLAMSVLANAKVYSVFKSGSWNGNIFVNDKTGLFESCYIDGMYNSGSRLLFMYYPNGSKFIDLMITIPKNKRVSNGKLEMSLHVDKRMIYNGFALGSKRNNLYVLKLPKTGHVVNKLKNGQLLTIAGLPYRYALSGTAKAMWQLDKCIQKYQGQRYAVDKTAPKQHSAKAAPPKGYRMPRKIMLNFAHNMLENAGITEYKILPHEIYSPISDVAWEHSDGSQGFVYGLPSKLANIFTLKQISSEILKNDANSCKGEFVSANRKNRLYKGAEIRKLMTACNDGKNSSHSEYSLVKLATGEFIKLASARYGENASNEQREVRLQRQERTENAMFLAASFLQKE